MDSAQFSPLHESHRCCRIRPWEPSSPPTDPFEGAAVKLLHVVNLSAATRGSAAITAHGSCRRGRELHEVVVAARGGGAAVAVVREEDERTEREYMEVSGREASTIMTKGERRSK